MTTADTCRARIAPSWNDGNWTTCGSGIRADGKCARYGHEQAPTTADTDRPDPQHKLLAALGGAVDAARADRREAERPDPLEQLLEWSTQAPLTRDWITNLVLAARAARDRDRADRDRARDIAVALEQENAQLRAAIDKVRLVHLEGQTTKVKYNHEGTLISAVKVPSNSCQCCGQSQYVGCCRDDDETCDGPHYSRISAGYPCLTMRALDGAAGNGEGT